MTLCYRQSLFSYTSKLPIAVTLGGASRVGRGSRDLLQWAVGF